MGSECCPFGSGEFLIQRGCMVSPYGSWKNFPSPFLSFRILFLGGLRSHPFGSAWSVAASLGNTSAFHSGNYSKLCIVGPYSGKFSHGANFRAFHTHVDFMNKNCEILNCQNFNMWICLF